MTDIEVGIFKKQRELIDESRKLSDKTYSSKVKQRVQSKITLELRLLGKQLESLGWKLDIYKGWTRDGAIFNKKN